jgi:putative ABC transport system permease protein
VLAGAIFMMVNGVNNAAQYTFNGKLTSIHTYQISLSFEDYQRSQRIEKLAFSVPQIDMAESWLVVPGKARPNTQEESEVTDARISIFGIPAEPIMYSPELIEGRWLQPGDANAAVIHQRLAGQKNWGIGDTITLTDPREKDTNWQIVGIAYDPVANNAIFVPRSRLQREMNLTGQANTLWLQTSPKDGESLTAFAADLNQVFERRKFELAPSSTFGESTITALVEQTTGGYSLIITMLVIMAIIIALVGGVGLSGVLTLNVLERRREIGVMRSIGASNWRVIGLQIGEGLLLGWLSWIIALPVSIPAGYFFATKGLSVVLFNQLAYRFNPAGPLTWLVIITILAVFASLFPARNAAKISVRESLAYQ